MPKVRIDYRGSIGVAIDADPEDAEAWTAAIAQAWSAVSPDDVFEAADAVGHAIVCDECGMPDDGDPEAEIRPVSEAGAVLWLCTDCRPQPRRRRARS